MKKKLLFFCFLVVVFSVVMTLPLMASPVTADICYYCYFDWDEVPDEHCSDEYCTCEYVECSECGDSYLYDCCDNTHNDYEEIECADASCEYPAEIAKQCTYCGTVYDYEYVGEALGHDFNWTTITEATCTNDGSRSGHCSECGKKVTEVIPSLGHTYSESIASSTYLKSAATCTSAAVYYKSCVHCGKAGTSTFKSGSEDASNHTKGVVNGGTLTVHTKYQCCNAVASNVHSYTATVDTQPTCVNKGITKNTCSCGYAYTESNIEALGHDYIATVTPSTCVQEGYTTHDCLRCEDVYTDTPMPLAEHTWSETGREDPTCLSEGVQNYVCSVCGEAYADPIAALGHTYETAEVIPPTCTEIGYTLFKCIRCDDSYTDLEKNALGHIWIETEREEPNCINAGSQHYECSACHLGKSETISALDHSFELTETIPPTCIKQGYIIQKCIRCEEYEIVIGSYVATVDHEFRNGVCSMCGAFSSNGDDSSNRNDILSDDEEEQGIVKKFFSLLLASAVAGFPAYLYDRSRKKGG